MASTIVRGFAQLFANLETTDLQATTTAVRWKNVSSPCSRAFLSVNTLAIPLLGVKPETNRSHLPRECTSSLDKILPLFFSLQRR